MPIYDYQCKDETCGLIFEAIAKVDDLVECPNCGFSCKRLISASGVNTAMQDAEWIRSIREVVDKESPKPETQEFLKNPTRDNMVKWMKAEGVRHYETGEPLRPVQTDMRPIIKEMMERQARRHRVSL